MKFVKRNYLFIIITFVLIFFLSFNFISYQKTRQLEYEHDNTLITNCFKNEGKYSPGACIKLQEEITNKYKTKPSFYDTVSNILDNNFMFLDLILFLLIVIPTLYNLSDLLSDKTITHNMVKESFSKIKFNIFKQGYRYIWFYPTIILLFFIICLFISTNKETSTFLYTNINLPSSPIYVIIMYLLNTLFLTGTYLNLALIGLRIKHNYFLAILTSLLIFLITEVFLSIFINKLLIYSILNKTNYQGLFSIIGIFNIKIDNVINFNLRVFISFIIFFITFIITYLMYKNKEKLVISMEGK